MSQKQTWDKIAPEWHEFKTTPSTTATEFINNSKGKILDFGSGSGRNLLKLKKSKKRELYLVDFSDEMLKLAKKRGKKLGLKINTKVSKLEETDFPDNFFDSATCTHSLYCIETSQKRERAVKELYRVLKTGAKALISVWDKNSKRFKNSVKEKYIKWTDKGKRYYYLYDEKEVHDLFNKVGFKIIKKVGSNINITFIAKK